MRKQLAIAMLLMPSIAMAKMKTVAVIDTGLKTSIMAGGYKNGICKMGHKDFTGEGLDDLHGHGTNISGLIQANAEGAEYCQVIIKFYRSKPDSKCIERKNKEWNAKWGGIAHLVENWLLEKKNKRFVEECAANDSELFVKAIDYAIKIKPDYINISGGGNNFIQKEKQLIDKAIKLKIKVIAAAGNEGRDLKWWTYYPAIYNPKVIVVGNGKSSKKSERSPVSNYGDRVNVWEDGTDQTAYGITLSGTSQATAIQTGKTVYKDYMKRVYDESRKNKATKR